MTDSKKRLEKILKEFFNHFAGVNDYGCKECKKFRDKILKEFVHKDNLPNMWEIGESILEELRKTNEYVGGDDIEYTICLDGEFDLKSIAKAIRKLIEGDRSV